MKDGKRGSELTDSGFPYGCWSAYLVEQSTVGFILCRHHDLQQDAIAYFIFHEEHLPYVLLSTCDLKC